jgi:integrase
MKKSVKYGSRVMLNILKNGDTSYFAVFNVKGKKYVKKVGLKSNGITESIVIEYRNRWTLEARHQKTTIQKHPLALNELAQYYFEYLSIHAKSANKIKQNYYKHISKSLGDSVAFELNDLDILRLQSSLKDKKLADSSINQIVGILSRIINFGIEKSYIEFTKIKKIKKLKVNNVRNRFIPKSEIESFLKEEGIDKRVFNFILLAVFTGARVGAVLKIRYRDFDWENQKIKLNDDKRNMVYSIDISPVIIEHIKPQSIKSNKNNFVVSGASEKMKYATIRYQLTKLFAGLNDGIDKADRKEKIVIHSLRHSFASYLAIAKAPALNIKEMLNQADIRNTERYLHLIEDVNKTYINEIGELRSEKK